MERLNISSGSPYEGKVGFCRAVKVGNTIEVAGTAPIKDGETLIGSAYDQTRLCLQIIEDALKQCGAELSNVVRTRIYVTDVSEWEEVGKAHGEFFAEIRPASTMVEVKGLIDPAMKVEIEATALLA